MKRHDQRFHLKQGSNTEFKCDFCNNIFVDKRTLYDHIQNISKKCTLCARIFPTNKSLESHETAIHKKGRSKHKIERDPSMKKHKTKETI